MAHVFLSYVRDNRELVDRLASDLRDAGVTVWLDRNDIEPGARWQDAIERAIEGGRFFIACFSKEYRERDESYMNEELTLAIDRLRQRDPDSGWFVPVLLNETQIPKRRISAGQRLDQINAVALYEDWEGGLHRLLKVLRHDNQTLARAWKLVEIAEGPFDEERLHAIEALDKLAVREAPVIRALAKAVDSSNRNIRFAGLNALQNPGPAAAGAVPALIRALDDDERLYQTLALEALGKAGSAAVGAVPALLEFLKDKDREFQLKRVAVDTLGKIGADAVPVLVAALRDPALFDWDPYDRSGCAWAVCALGRVGPAAIPALLASLKDNAIEPGPAIHALCEIWVAAPETLKEIGTSLLPTLIAALDKPQSVGDAGYALKLLGPAAAEAAPALNTAFEKFGGPTLAGALGSLGAVAAPAVPALVAAFEASRSDDDRTAIAVALGQIGPAAASSVPALARSLKHPFYDVYFAQYEFQRLAEEALRKIGPGAANAVPELVRALQDGDVQVRWGAGFALSTLGPAAIEAIPALIAVLNDPELQSGFRTFDGNFGRSIAATALGAIGPAAIEALASLLPSRSEEEVRRGAFDALGAMGEAAVPTLLTVLQQGDRDQQRLAIHALSIIGPRAAAAVPALLHHLRDREMDFRSRVEYGLVRIGPPAVAALTAALEGRGRVVKKHAEAALREIEERRKKGWYRA